jgi:hypothetical protein
MSKFWQRDTPPATDVENTDHVPPPTTWASVPRWRLGLTLLLALLNAGLSAALLMQHHGDARGAAAVSQVCGAGEKGRRRAPQLQRAESDSSSGRVAASAREWRD